MSDKVIPDIHYSVRKVLKLHLPPSLLRFELVLETDSLDSKAMNCTVGGNHLVVTSTSSEKFLLVNIHSVPQVYDPLPEPAAVR